MQGWGGRTRPADAQALVDDVRAACRELGYIEESIAAPLAYVMWGHWHANDAPVVFRAIGRRIKREVLVARGILPQTVLTDEAWAAMTEEGRRVGPVQAYQRTATQASARWLDGYKRRNPRWLFAFRRAQEAPSEAATHRR